jgi:hypothetical protein
MPQWQIQAQTIMVPPARLDRLHVASLDQVRYDALRGAFGDSDLFGNSI